ncbi:MAG TPA: hypothetical protein VL970_15085 [Candidatus Acidoferrales bacterium]|nr:hypothetical protein [Candidatus Acidoferrales bacterium]
MNIYAFLSGFLGCGVFLIARPAMAGAGGATNSAGNYSADLGVVHDAQQQALAQARQVLAQAEGGRDRSALEAAVKQMELAETALDNAKKNPGKLAAALAAEQAAYQALLKAAPREYRMAQSRSGRQSESGAGQASQREMNELDMQREENRYETESQASAPQNAQQRAQTQTAGRLKELSQRQQDLNGRLRDLQTALQAARTDAERADVQRQLKRLQEEQRQMLANVDELRQTLEQSPNAGSQADTQRQLEQTRSDMERAAQEMERQSPSGALAAGTRAQETMQNLRDDLRGQTSSQFREQMRQLRGQARDLTKQEDEIARRLDSLNNGEHQALDNSAERGQITQQMERQQSSLTNLLAQMRAVTEQAETTEPLLSKQLYDTLRRADQMHAENLLQMGSELTARGFLSEASQVEHATRTNLTELASSIERAADSVLGNEADALRYAQKELADLTQQAERDAGSPDTNNAAHGIESRAGEAAQSNRVARANAGAESPGGERNTNSITQANGPSAAGNNPNGRNRAGDGRRANNAQGEGGQAETQTQAGEMAGGGGERLRELAVQLGGGGGAGGLGNNGPITGNDYVSWSEHLQDVEQVVDPEDLRNELATVRERAAALRAEYREHGRKPDADAVRRQIVTPLTQVRAWLQEELARREKSDSLVPLDRDPVPDNYAELVREYYQKLGSAQ